MLAFLSTLSLYLSVCRSTFPSVYCLSVFVHHSLTYRLAWPKLDCFSESIFFDLLSCLPWLVFSVCPNLKGTEEFIVVARIFVVLAELWNNKFPEWMIYGLIEEFCLEIFVLTLSLGLSERDKQWVFWTHVFSYFLGSRWPDFMTCNTKLLTFLHILDIL